MVLGEDEVVLSLPSGGEMGVIGEIVPERRCLFAGLGDSIVLDLIQSLIWG